MGLRERKKAETRSAISWAAIRLAVERGFDNVKVEDIAEAAGVSPRTFNNYYSSKGEAIAARHTDRVRNLAAALRERPADESLWDAIGASAVAQFGPDLAATENPVTDPATWTAGVRATLAAPALQGDLLKAGASAEAEIAAAVADRTGTSLDRDLYPHLVAAAVVAAVNTAIGHHLRTERPVADLLAEALSQVAAGLTR
ncbi:TetR family transcriptional regulator [Amycolatopsis endophytica]|uniref:AcrR family transcriptional regulator n=1 Tax=Amycolatopsis endophytica TaxID=860233 RepID=A0A853B641_9PSEU|nr:TetR family transcriptional regulator [Amycolatopsis endophytica]NYI90016.1 AcrR family transcriptional regulator [Amycolatopsis endophytica]